MAERDRPHGVTQRRLELEPPPSPEPPPTEAPEPTPAAPPPPISREPSGGELRARQLRWLKERARFESRERALAAEREGK